MFKNKSILITGGTGSFGNYFVNYLLKNFSNLKKIVVFSRDEYKQNLMQDNFKKVRGNNKLRFFLGDVRDKSRLSLAFREIDIVVHAAALKQVPAAEYNPIEFVKTNVLGSQNIIECALESKIKKIIALSTDKACSPINLYGATKLCADKLFISANNIKGNQNITFAVVRYGNVINSRGSVVPKLIAQKDKGLFELTDLKMTRFSITLKQGVEAVIWALKKCSGGEIVIPKIPSYSLPILARAINKKNKIMITGIREGEKTHEEMVSASDSNLTIDIGKYYLILKDQIHLKKMIKILSGKKVKSGFVYSSNNNSKFLDENQLKKIIQNETGVRLF